MTNVSKPTAPAVECTHQAEFLGTNQDLHFLLCRPCGKVFLQQGGKLIAVPLAAAQNDATDASDWPARAVGE